MRLFHTLLAASLALSPLFPAQTARAQTPAPAPSTAAPTVAEAQAFMDKAEAELLDLSNQAAYAEWVQETNITDDTEAISAKANERVALRTNELVLAARRFDSLALPTGLARKFQLLKLNGSPTDPKLAWSSSPIRAPASSASRTPETSGAPATT